jgi:uncharacterized protein YdcH (DUF465 family)
VDESLIKERLLAENPEFRRLLDEHHAHDRALGEIEARSFPTSEDQLREKDLKKRKLLIKDKMALLIQDYRKSQEG